MSMHARLDTRILPEGAGEIRLVATLRNEITRLPYWFEHYRKLGVSRFLCVDDHSDDGTTDYLLAQPDAHVFVPQNSYSESNSGTDWQNALLDEYGEGRWTLVADADELLVYPYSERLSLPEFCALLDEEGSDALYCFLLDMYPNGDLSAAICEAGKPFYEICDYFDSDYKVIQRFEFLVAPEMRFPPREVIGGPRMRKFYPLQGATSLVSRVRNRLFWKACAMLANAGFPFSDRPHSAPTLFKVPLVKWRKGYARLSGHHIRATQGGLSAATGILLHFKFFADFHDKAKLESVRGEHYAGGQEYKRYLRYIASDPDISFIYPGSVKYEGTQSLMGHGLMVSPPWLDSKARNL